MKSTHTTESREVQVTSPEEMRQQLEQHFSIDYQQTSLQDIVFHSDGTIEFAGNRMPHTDWVHDLLVKFAKIPLGFEQDLTFDQFSDLFETRKHDKACPLTVCVSNDTVVGIAPAHYGYQSATGGVAKTLDFLQQLDLGNDAWQFESATVSDTGSKINLIIPGSTSEPEKGDVINHGMTISNSETGGQSLTAEMFTRRLVCRNGMISKTNRTSVVYTKFGRMSSSAKMSLFTKRLEAAKSRVAQVASSLYDGVADSKMFDVDLISLHRTLNRRLERTELDADEVLGIGRRARLDIAGMVRDRDSFAPPEPTDLSAWRIHNAITAVGRDQRLPLRMSLEQLGGNVLQTARRRRIELASQSHTN